MAATIYYDGKCPLCEKYTTLLKLRQVVGRVDLVDVRADSAARDRLHHLGYDLDSGMVFEHAGSLYGGARAINKIARLTEGNDFFSKITTLLFSNAALANLLYPLMRAGRNSLLFLLGRERIKAADKDDAALFSLFAHVWGVCAFLQLAYVYYFRDVLEVQPTVWIVGALGAMLAVRPRSQGLFVALTGVMVVEALMQLPSSSNSTALKNYVLLSILISAGYCMLRGSNWSSFMHGFAPVARCLLLIMYIFGVFHKLNADFLNPEVSCAVALWRLMPEPLNLIDHPWFSQLTIWGTLVLETAILLGLLAKKTRFYAVVGGVSFHSMLAMSGYGFYPTFSTLSIALHMLFVAPAAAQRLTESAAWLPGSVSRGANSGALLLVAWFLLLWCALLQNNSTLVGLAWMPWAAWLLYVVVRHGRDLPTETTLGPAVFSRMFLINVVAMAFFVSCSAPYLGLKTAQSINMFANLQLEGGRSNHLLVPASQQRFPYLQDIVQPFDVFGSSYLRYIQDNGLYITYYDLLNQLERNQIAQVSFWRGGELKSNQSAEKLSDEIARLLHPRWVRNWMVFNPVDLGSPKKCWGNQ